MRKCNLLGYRHERSGKCVAGDEKDTEERHRLVVQRSSLVSNHGHQPEAEMSKDDEQRSPCEFEIAV